MTITLVSAHETSRRMSLEIRLISIYVVAMTRKTAVTPRMAQTVLKNCMCLRVQRASRVVGRMFDDAFRPLGLNNFQFSLLMLLNRPISPTIGGLAADLSMDRTTITANLKPLER